MMNHILLKIKLISIQIQINTLFNTDDIGKRRVCGRSIDKAMRTPTGNHQKKPVTFQPKNACKLEFTDHLWLYFLDKPQYGIVVFEIITFQINNILVTKWKNGIVTNDKISFNEEL